MSPLELHLLANAERRAGNDSEAEYYATMSEAMGLVLDGMASGDEATQQRGFALAIQAEQNPDG